MFIFLVDIYKMSSASTGAPKNLDDASILLKYTTASSDCEHGSVGGSYGVEIPSTSKQLFASSLSSVKLMLLKAAIVLSVIGIGTFLAVYFTIMSSDTNNNSGNFYAYLMILCVCINENETGSK